MAPTSARVSSLGYGLLVLVDIPAQWRLGEDPQHAAREGARQGGARADTVRGNNRQPERQDDGKRGVRGYDAGKKVNGRKRHIVVDTIGLIIAVVVHAANIQDRDGAKLVMAKITCGFPRLQLIWADGGYAGKLIKWVMDLAGWVLEIIKRTDDMKGFVVLPRRWVVERTFAWLGRYRRLSKDYEELPETGEAMIMEPVA